MMVPMAQFAQMMVTPCIICRARGPSRPGATWWGVLEPARGSSSSPVWVAVGSNGMCGVEISFPLDVLQISQSVYLQHQHRVRRLARGTVGEKKSTRYVEDAG
jgi:hypothetical protein